jgi:hypothetical protein
MSVRVRPGAIALAVLGLAVLAPVSGLPQPAHVEKHARREHVVDAGREFAKQEQQVRRARSLLRRLLRDQRTSPEIKQRASELDELLDRRDALLATLDARYKEFVAKHKAEIDELEDLHRRAHEIDGRLSAARSELVRASEGEIKALKEGSARAAELGDALRAAYGQERHEHRRR